MENEQTRPYHSVDVQVGSTEYSVPLGSSVVVPFAIANHTGQEGYFDIQVAGIPSAWLLLDLPVMHLAAGERRQASLTIQAPGNSPVSVGDYPLTIHAVSQSNAAWRGEAQVVLRVKTFEQTIPAAAVDSSDRVSLLINTTQFAIAPGETLTIPVVIANRGLREDTFMLSVEGLPPSWVSAGEPYVRLMPGEHQETLLHISPMPDSSSRAGRHPFTLRVTALSDPAQATAVEALLTMAAVNAFAISLAPARVDAGKNARVTIVNQGNVQETFTVRFQSMDVDLDFVPSISGPIRLMPGETAAIDFAVSPRNPNWFGRQVAHAYTVFVQPASGGTQATSGEVLSLPLIPVWVLPALAVLCLTSVCLAGFLWNWNQNRLTVAEQTEEARIGMIEEQTATAAGAVTATVEWMLTESAAQTATIAATLNVPTDTPVPTETPTITPTETLAPPTSTFTSVPPTAAPTLAPVTDTPVPTNTAPPPTATLSPPTATVEPEATSTVIPLPVTGEQIIAFTSNREGSPQLYVYNSQGGTLTALLEAPGADTQPAWSPDGQRLLFTSERDGNNEVYMINTDGTDLVNLTNAPSNDRFPAWSPDGDQIAFTSDRDGNDEIYTMNIDGSELTNVTNNPAADIRPAWYAETGLLSSTSRIVFASNRDGNDEIYALTLGSEDPPVNLTNNPSGDTLPAVPFQGGSVSFVSDRDGNLEIYTMDPDGENQTNQTNHPASDTKPVWSRDGEWIAFTTDRDGNREIYIMNASGGDITNISRNPAEDIDPAWR